MSGAGSATCSISKAEGMYYLAKQHTLEDPDYIETVVWHGLVHAGDGAVLPATVDPITADSNMLIAHTPHVSGCLSGCPGCETMRDVPVWTYNQSIEGRLRRKYMRKIHDDPELFCFRYLKGHGRRDTGYFVGMYKVMSIPMAKKADGASSYTECEYQNPSYKWDTAVVDPSLVDRFGILFSMGFLISDKVFDDLNVDFNERYWRVAYM